MFHFLSFDQIYVSGGRSLGPVLFVYIFLYFSWFRPTFPPRLPTPLNHSATHAPSDRPILFIFFIFQFRTRARLSAFFITFFLVKCYRKYLFNTDKANTIVFISIWKNKIFFHCYSFFSIKHWNKFHINSIKIKSYT